MRKLLLLTLIGVLPVSAGYSVTYKITIAHDQVGGADLANYPLTVCTCNNASLASVVQSQMATVGNGGAVTSTNGYDIIFTADQAGLTTLSFERVSWSAATGASEFHVLVPSVSASADTVVWLQIGNSAVSTDQSAAHSVWSNGYVYVDHLTGGVPSDSTVNNNGGTATALTSTAGIIGTGASFNGSTSQISAPNSGIYDTPNSTVQFWANLTSVGFFVAIGTGTGPAARYQMFLSGSSMGLWNGSGFGVFGPTYPLGSWHQVTLTNSASTSTLYLDGIHYAPLAIGTGAAALLPMVIGPNTAGSFDEFRLTNNVLPAGWVAADFNSQRSPSTFLTASLAPPVLSLAGPPSGNLLTSSPAYTVTLSGASFDGLHSVTIADGDNLGTITPSSGAAAVSPITVTPPTGTTFTFTYTPSSIGAKTISVGNPSGWTPPTPQTYLVTSPDVCTFTAAADGNDDAPATWTASPGCGHGTPRSGDKRVITGFHVVVPSGVTSFGGSCPANNTTYDLQLTPAAGKSGWFEVAGSFWLCGNTSLNAPNVSNPGTFAIYQLDTGATLTMDENGGTVAYRMAPSTEYGWNNLRIGTAGDACIPATPNTAYVCPTRVAAANVSGVNPTLIDTNGTDDNITYQVYGAAIVNCGSASKACIEYSSQGIGNSYPGAGIFDFEGNIFDGTGTLNGGANGMSVGLSKITLKNNKFLNDLLGVFNLTGGGGNFTNPCLLQNNYFSGHMNASQNSGWGGCRIYGNAFPGSMEGFSSYAPFGAFQNNFLRVENDKIASAAIGIADNYFLDNAATGSSHFFSTNIPDNVSLRNNIFEVMNQSGGTEGHCFGWGAGSVNTSTAVITGNLSIAGALGYNSCNEFAWLTDNGGNQALGYVDHNGANGHGAIGMHGFWGHSATGSYAGNYPANTVLQTFRSNMSWDSSVNSGNVSIATEYTSSPYVASVPVDNVNVAGIDFNNNFNMLTATTFQGGVNTGCNPSSTLGTFYDICTRNTGSVGTHEKTLDPHYIDPTRNAAKWASSRGYPQTFNGVLTALQQCSDVGYCVQNLITWVRQGYQPTNLGLKGQAHDGAIVGITGTPGSGYSGSCVAAFSPKDASDLGSGAVATCTFPGGVPRVTLTKGGQNYRIFNPALVTISCGGCTPAVPAALTVIISPADVGPVPMSVFAGAQ